MSQGGFISQLGDTEITSEFIISDNAVVRGDGGGRGVQDSGVLIDDSDNVTGVTSLSAGSASLTTPLPIASGGTAAATVTEAFDGLAPTTTKGDVIVSNGTDNIRVAIGADDTVLTADAAEASGVKWAAAAGGGGGAWTYIKTVTASNSATVDITGLDSTYACYKLIGVDIRPQTDTSYLQIRTSTDSGSTYDSGATDYRWTSANLSTAMSFASGQSAQIDLGNSLQFGTSAGEIGHIELTIYNPSNASYNTVLRYEIAMSSSSAGVMRLITGTGARTTAEDVDSFQLFFSAGNVALGAFRLYGINNS